MCGEQSVKALQLARWLSRTVHIAGQEQSRRRLPDPPIDLGGVVVPLSRASGPYSSKPLHQTDPQAAPEPHRSTSYRR
jgi:hypothetical protein